MRTQAVIRATHRAARTGARARASRPRRWRAKWFDKNLALSATHRTSTSCASRSRLAIELYTARGFDTPFGLYAGAYREQQARGAALGLNPLVASYGPALLDRAIARCARARRPASPSPEMISRNVLGHRRDRADARPRRLRPRRASSAACAWRRRSRCATPSAWSIRSPPADQKPGERVDDGLPETLEEVVRHYRGRYYKLKVGGDIAADLERLTPHRRRARPRAAGDYRATLDGNEQYDERRGHRRAVAAHARDAGAAHGWSTAIAVHRAADQARRSALSRPVDALARLKPLDHRRIRRRAVVVPGGAGARLHRRLEQELQGLLQVDPQRRARRQAQRRGRAAAQYFMSAEDLTTLAGVSVQQDLALVVAARARPMSSATATTSSTACRSRPRREQAAFAPRPSRSLRANAPARRGCASRTGASRSARSTARALPLAAEMDFAAMRPMPAAPHGRDRPALSREGGMSARPARALRQRRRARGFHDRADARA